MEIKDYETKTPEDIKKANSDKLQTLNLDRHTLEE